MRLYDCMLQRGSRAYECATSIQPHERIGSLRQQHVHWNSHVASKMLGCGGRGRGDENERYYGDDTVLHI